MRVRVGGPDLRPAQRPAAFDLTGSAAHGGEIGAGVGFAHSQRPERLRRGDPRQEALTLLLGTEREDRRRRLAVGYPVRADRGASGQQFLDHHEPFYRRPPVPSVPPRDRHAHPAARGELAAEVRPVGAAYPKTGIDAHVGHLFRQEPANLSPRRLLRRGGRGDAEGYVCHCGCQGHFVVSVRPTADGMAGEPPGGGTVSPSTAGALRLATMAFSRSATCLQLSRNTPAMPSGFRIAARTSPTPEISCSYWPRCATRSRILKEKPPVASVPAQIAPETVLIPPR